MCERIGNYDISTETRELQIQWAKVQLLRHEKHKLRKSPPPPFGQIKQDRTGAILGREIRMAGSLTKAVAERIAKSQNAWGIVNIRLRRYKVINPRIKILLWNSLIRSAIIYGLHTQDIQKKLLGEMDTYMYRHLRMMPNPRWKQEEWCPSKNILYRTLQQPTMRTWLDKTQVRTVLTHTQETKTIHPIECAEMRAPTTKPREQ